MSGTMFPKSLNKSFLKDSFPHSVFPMNGIIPFLQQDTSYYDRRRKIMWSLDLGL